MAQLTSSLCSTFGFLCCLFFLPASWEAGANTFQELQKSGESSTSDHLLTLTPDLPHRTLSAHADLYPGQRPPDLPKSTSTKKPRKQCKPAHKPIDDSKATDHQNGTVHHETSPTLEKDANSQRRDPVIRNGRSADDTQSTKADKGSNGSPSTSAPRRTTTCKPRTNKTRVTRNSGTPVVPVDTSTRLRSTSHKPTTASHHSEVSRKTTSSSVKSSEAPRTSYRTPRTPATSGAEDHRTSFASEKPVQTTREHKEITSASERTTRPQVTLPEHEGENVSANERTTRPQATPTQYKRKTLSANERTTHGQVMHTDYERENASANGKITRSQETSTETEGETVSANERTTTAQVRPIEHGTTSANEKTTHVSAKSTATSTTQRATKVSERPTVFWRKTTLATESIKATENPEKTVAVPVTTRPPVKATEHKSTTVSLHFHEAETTHEGLIRPVTTRTDLGPITSEAQYPQQNIHSLSGGVHNAAAGESSSFPAWAIVIVILIAVIVLLISIGLIFLIACASRTRHVLAQNSEDADPEERGGRNSYPVYLMEQQNLKPNQIPSPP